MLKRSILFVVLLAATPIAAQNRGAPYRVDELGRSFGRLQDAFNAIGNGGGTVTIAPGTYRDCGVFRGGAVMVRAAQPGTVIFDGGACDNKGTLVLGGRNAHVTGLIFQNIAVGDKNGSGIRLENGDLFVENSIFRNSEQGILTNAYAGGNVVIDKVTFSGLGGCPGGMCSHSIYISDINSLKVTRSRFERGAGGHYLKSRAARVEISDNSFDDSRGNQTNYMIDMPAGSRGLITGNTFVLGRSKENYSVFIAIGAEKKLHPTSGLAIFNNSATLAPGASWAGKTNFVADWTHEPIKMTNNRIAAGIKPFAPVD